MYTSEEHHLNGMSAMQNILRKRCVGSMVYDSILNILSTEKKNQEHLMERCKFHTNKRKRLLNENHDTRIVQQFDSRQNY